MFGTLKSSIFRYRFLRQANARLARISTKRLAPLSEAELLELRTMLTTYTVNTTLDAPADGSGVTDNLISLREAIMAANTNAAFGDAVAGSEIYVDIINFDASLAGQTITLGGQQLVISDDLIISANGLSPITIDANGLSRHFHIASSVTVEISTLNLFNGNANPNGADDQIYGGGAIENEGILTLSDSTVSDNEGDISGGGIYNKGVLHIETVQFSRNDASYGGAIENFGTLNVSDGTFSNNSATYGGAIRSIVTATIENSLFSNNSARSTGGAINQGGTGSSTIRVTNSTFSGNSADKGGSAYAGQDGSFTAVNSTFVNNSVREQLEQHGAILGTFEHSENQIILHNSIVAGNFNTTTNTPDDIGANLDPSSSNNVIGNAATAGGLTNGVNGNIVGVNGSGTREVATILDTTLRDNGGPTLSHKLVTGSVALDTGNNSKAVDKNDIPLTTDQRGTGYSRILNSTVDIGAFEATTAQTYVINTLLDEPANGAEVTDNLISLREAILAANTNAAFGDAVAGSPDFADIINFAPELAGQTITLGGSQLLISDDLIINGLGANQLTLDGNDSSRIFETGPETIVEISGLKLTGGNGTPEVAEVIEGGAINNNGNLTLIGLWITENTAQFGGAIDNDSTADNVSMTIIDSTISANTVVGRGGAIFNDDPLIIINTTISDNIAGQSGGGITGYQSAVNVLIRNSTITGNRALSDYGLGGGIYRVAENITLHNTIVAGNVSGTVGQYANDLSGSVSGSHNLIGNAISSGGLTNGTNGNIVGVNGVGTRDINTILDTTLRTNGAAVPTHALVHGSAALNAGNNSLVIDANSTALTTDQRGTGFARILNSTVDIGAFEASATQNSYVVTTLSDTTTADGLLSLREAIQAANGYSCSTDVLPGSPTQADVITFAPNLSGTLTIGGMQISITDDLTITGPGSGTLQLDGQFNSRIFQIGHINEQIDVAISGLSLIRGGDQNGAAGATIDSMNVNLSLIDVQFNNYGNGGGSLHSVGGSLSLNNVTRISSADFISRSQTSSVYFPPEMQPTSLFGPTPENGDPDIQDSQSLMDLVTPFQESTLQFSIVAVSAPALEPEASLFDTDPQTLSTDGMASPQTLQLTASEPQDSNSEEAEALESLEWDAPLFGTLI